LVFLEFQLGSVKTDFLQELSNYLDPSSLYLAPSSVQWIFAMIIVAMIKEKLRERGLVYLQLWHAPDCL